MGRGTLRPVSPEPKAAELDMLRTCRRCGEEKQLRRFAVNRSGHFHRGHVCTACDSARKRFSEKAMNPLSDEAAVRLVESAPDPVVAARLGSVLSVHRRHDLPFEQAWRGALAVALDGLGPQRRRDWVDVLSWSKPAWAASYLREPWPEPFVSLDVAVLDVAA